MLIGMAEALHDRRHHAIVDAQFGPRAQAYVESAVHAAGPDLDALGRILQDVSPTRALDVGTGGGHVAYLLARHAQFVTATDLSDEMVAVVARTASERGLQNIETVKAPVERLPFEDARFDFVACRFSAHHWSDLEAGLREVRRVAQPGAAAIFIDAYSPGRALLDTHLQAIELLRDMSHVRDYTTAEWSAALSRAGFTLSSYRTWRLRLEFSSWIARMHTPADNVRAIQALQAAAAEETRTHFAIEADGSFMLDVHMLETRAR
jgi:ubiquinone/menaquinone biosynthesis C-methylase UbiE